MMANWTFLTNHAQAPLSIAQDPEVRLRDIAASRGITERSAYGTVTDLAEAGYVVKQKNGRPNRYQTRAHLPLPEPSSQERTAGDVLALLADTEAMRFLAGLGAGAERLRILGRRCGCGEAEGRGARGLRGRRRPGGALAAAGGGAPRRSRRLRALRRVRRAGRPVWR